MDFVGVLLLGASPSRFSEIRWIDTLFSEGKYAKHSLLIIVVPYVAPVQLGGRKFVQDREQKI